jgi:hypothetical protein
MSVFLMRLASLPVVAALGTLAVAGLTGCSGAADDTSLPRSQSKAPTRLPTRAPASSGDTTPTTTPPSSTPAPSPDAGAAPAPAPAPPATPPVPGSCAAPKCFGLAGVGGCKATDSTGALVTMGCQDGACACVAADQTTTTFDGDVTSGSDAHDLFLTNCTCN